MRASVQRLIPVIFLIIGIVAAGCITDDTPPPAPPVTNIPQKGVLIQAFGDVTGQGILLKGVPRGTIDTVTFSIGRAPGAKPVDITNMTIVYSDAVRTEVLEPVEGYRGDPPPGYWGIVDAANELGNKNTRLEFEKQFIIRIHPKAPVVPNQVITISVKPVDSKPLILRRVAPSTIFEGDNTLLGL